MNQFTTKVLARTQLAEKLLTDKDRFGNAGLLEEDLVVVATMGRAAEKADSEQQAQLATQSASVTMRKSVIDAARDEEKRIRDRALAVISDLEGKGLHDQALFLARLSYSRFRIRELADASTDGAPESETDTVRKVEQVEREDMPTSMKGLAGYCTALLAEGREPIVECFAARGISRESIEATASNANALAEAGRNIKRAAEATAREHDAVAAQREKWRPIRRLVRSAVQGSSELTTLFAAC